MHPGKPDKISAFELKALCSDLAEAALGMCKRRAKHRIRALLQTQIVGQGLCNLVLCLVSRASAGVGASALGFDCHLCRFCVALGGLSDGKA